MSNIEPQEIIDQDFYNQPPERQNPLVWKTMLAAGTIGVTAVLSQYTNNFGFDNLPQSNAVITKTVTPAILGNEDGAPQTTPSEIQSSLHPSSGPSAIELPSHQPPLPQKKVIPAPHPAEHVVVPNIRKTLLPQKAPRSGKQYVFVGLGDSIMQGMKIENIDGIMQPAIASFTNGNRGKGIIGSEGNMNDQVTENTLLIKKSDDDLIESGANDLVMTYNVPITKACMDMPGLNGQPHLTPRGQGFCTVQSELMERLQQISPLTHRWYQNIVSVAHDAYSEGNYIINENALRLHYGVIDAYRVVHGPLSHPTNIAYDLAHPSIYTSNLAGDGLHPLLDQDARINQFIKKTLILEHS